MGATNISGLGKLFLTAQQVAEPGNTGKEGGGIDFSRVMSQMTALAGGNAAFGNQQMTSPQDAVLTREPVSGSEYDRYRCRENEIRQQTGDETPVADRVSEKLDGYEKEVKDVLKEELGVTEEQIEEAMKALGITYADLLNPNQLAALVSELTGAADMGALLCDGGFLNVMQEVGALGRELLEELGISKEQLEGLLQTAEPVPGEQTSEQTAAAGEAEAVPEPETPAEDGEIQTSVRTVEVEDHRSGNAQKSAQTDGRAEEPQENQKDMPEETSEMPGRAAKTEGSGHRQAGDGAGSQNPEPGNTAGVQNQANVVNAQAAGEMTEFSYRLDTENIIRQIVEHVRLNLSNTATTLEMQLNPEHLGKLYLQLTAKDGMVSARIMAQNEMVRAALESQVAELRESMEQSGVRVDAVEVTVSSHEFEKNLEQNARQQERQAEEQEKSAKRNRHINLNELDELSGVMTEEETLVAQMMAEQGNSIDFSA